MADSNPYRRPPFPNRPWITGALWDKYALSTILHCDAYALAVGDKRYLLIDWRQGGRKQIALDCYLIERDGLTEVWDAGRIWVNATPVFWHAGNNATMARLHKAVLSQQAVMVTLWPGRWTQVVTQCHYIHVNETDVEAGGWNKYAVEKLPDDAAEALREIKRRKKLHTRKPRVLKGDLPDIL